MTKKAVLLIENIDLLCAVLASELFGIAVETEYIRHALVFVNHAEIDFAGLFDSDSQGILPGQGGACHFLLEIGGNDGFIG